MIVTECEDFGRRYEVKEQRRSRTLKAEWVSLNASYSLIMTWHHRRVLFSRNGAFTHTPRTDIISKIIVL